MSLLNDALRAAEQRQNRPEVATAYTGQVRGERPGRSALWFVVLLLVAGLAAVPAIWFLNRDHSEADAGEATGNAPVVEAKEPQPQPQPQPQPETVVMAPERISEAPASEPTPSVERQAEQPVDAPVATVEHEASEAPVSGEPVSASTPEEELPAVKQVRETPEAMDRRVSQELASLLGNGEVAKAEQRLQALVAAQSAPVSREVFARRMLVEGKPEHALAWLPADVTAEVPDLRLLRARALHATGDLAGALSTLESSVPPVADNAGYRVTLATLLQQAGRSAESARHWSLLIVEDDSRAAWWVGLGIALETGGEPDSAARAYTQAAQLPGLSPSLADYVRERLRSLQAG
ncbi:tetratricopeptide repeat protein [Marinobacter sp.]|uniref:tetratricopeptide repeat protein n=1 Tax=Marinobacter sp. TaxID=50741 RepID=UPI0035C6AB2E